MVVTLALTYPICLCTIQRDPGRFLCWCCAVYVQGLSAQYPPSGGRGAVLVNGDDIEFLDPDAFLNDTVLDFYIK